MRSALRLLAESFSPRHMLPLFLAPRFWGLYALAAAPILLLATGAEDKVAWLLFYFSLVWALLFEAMIAPERGTGVLAVLLYAASIAVTVPLLFAFNAAGPAVSDALFRSPRFVARLAGALGIGLREEAFKLAPLAAMAALLAARGRPLTLRQGLVLGAVCGVAFAAAENVLYFARFEAHDRAAHLHGAFTQVTLEGTFTRVLLMPFMHGTWSGLAGFFTAWAARTAGQRAAVAGSGLGAAALLHGLYNVSAPAPWVTLLVILFTFHLFTRCVVRAREASWTAAAAAP